MEKLKKRSGLFLFLPPLFILILKIPTAYEIFCSNNRTTLAPLDLNEEDIKSTLRLTWRKASFDEKEKFKALEKEEREKYEQARIEKLKAEGKEIEKNDSKGNGEAAQKRPRASSQDELIFLLEESDYDDEAEDEDFHFYGKEKKNEKAKKKKTTAPKKSTEEKAKEMEQKLKEKKAEREKKSKERKAKKSKEKNAEKEQKIKAVNEQKNQATNNAQENQKMGPQDQQKAKINEDANAEKDNEPKVLPKSSLFNLPKKMQNSSAEGKAVAPKNKPTLLIKKYTPLVSSTNANE
jgi:hypothetical protein